MIPALVLFARKYWQSRKVAAAVAIVLPPLVLLVFLGVAVDDGVSGLVGLAGFSIALSVSWYALIRTGPRRFMGFAVAVLVVIATVSFLIVKGDHLMEVILIIVGVWLTTVCARSAFRVRVPLPDATAPKHPVLFYNPRSGGGKAEKFKLADEARLRGIKPIELTMGTDLEDLVREAVEDGADALSMAGGDGSQAVVAAVAAEFDLPYSCIPAGTRNHFALDLGVDRDDVVGALDSLVDGGEKRVDLAEINGKVFVNNVSLGLYAEAVQRDEYRDAKIRTILATLPEQLGPDASGPELRWKGPDGVGASSTGAAILVSNNCYRLGKAVGSGTRPKIDDGLLGITVASTKPEEGGHARPGKSPWQQWSAVEFEVDGDGQVAAGIDGEAVRIDTPLNFRIRPGVLRVRIAKSHPGASPSAQIPEGLAQSVGALVGVLTGQKSAKEPDE